ncbi:MAG TPA: hypothetical protein VNZ52_16165 [Candidatus Thermoplasmatota archaeon]|nr:hypothetical protein [Candidatus Thermoplasmatota archaeon]
MAMFGNKSGKMADEALARVLQEGLAGRKALMRAYETVAERVPDEEIKGLLQQFAEEERREYAIAEGIVREHGGDPTRISGIRDEVVQLLSRRMFSSGETPYSMVRDLTILYGMEAAGQLGAKSLQPVAENLDDARWRSALMESVDRAKVHMDSLRGCVESYSSQFQDIGDGLGGSALPP